MTTRTDGFQADASLRTFVAARCCFLSFYEGATSGLGNQPRVRLQNAQTDNMTGTSIKTPTTVASAAPDSGPNRAMAVATASSKKLLAPMSAPGAATEYCTLEEPHQAISQRGVEVDLDENRNRDQKYVKRFAKDVVRLKREDQDQGGKQRQHADWGEARQQHFFEPLLAAPPDEPLAKSNTSRQRDHNENDHGIEQNLERHVQARTRH